MIDFHTHILPNIDDGSKSIEETFNLIKEAKQAGFDKIIYTPHYEVGFFETDVKERTVWLNAISKNLNDLGVKTYLGSEIFITEDIIKLLEERKASTINDSSYVLFELPFNTEPMNLYDVIYSLQKYKLVPILAHPERYSFVQREPDLVYMLVKKGVLIQCNYGSIAGQYGKKAKFVMEKLLENNLVHFLGTDVHKENTIYSKIPNILEQLTNIVGEERLKEITSINPDLAINNKRIDIREPIKVKLNYKEKIRIKLMR